ncbi:MAG: sugar phosphate isomerase/epimerase [Anaerolineales bacterium]|nr:sugar phosphate isomerase/epimerase [Anaerolineales bacterium]
MKISIISYAFYGLQKAGVMDIFGYLESCRHRYGLDAADIWNGTLASLDDDHLHRVREALDERELTLACFAVDGAHIWEADPELRERNYRAALAHLRAAELLGARAVRIDIGGRDSAMSDEQFDAVVRRYQEYAQRAFDGGYRIGPETHFGPALVPENMQRIYEAVASPAYGTLLHIGHWVEGREDEGDALVAPWTFHTHVDWRITTTCLERKIALLQDAGYQGYWGVEHHTGEDEYSEVAIQVATVRHALERRRRTAQQPTS